MPLIGVPRIHQKGPHPSRNGRGPGHLSILSLQGTERFREVRGGALTFRDGGALHSIARDMLLARAPERVNLAVVSIRSEHGQDDFIRPLIVASSVLELDVVYVNGCGIT